MPIWLGTTNSNWSDPANWDTGVIPTDSTDAIFSSANNNPCVVDITNAVCRNLDFSSGTGYGGTITMTNGITVGSPSGALANQSVALSASMTIAPAGTGAITVRANGTTNLRSNGKAWPNAFNLSTINVGTSSFVILLDDWSVGSLTLGPQASHDLTIQGAFNFTINGNFLVRPVGAGARIASVLGSVPTFILAKTGTWSTTVVFGTTTVLGFGVNLTINAPGETITIADNCYFGGNFAPGATFTHTAGTVVHNGTFYLLTIQGGPTFNLDVKGSSASSPTNTNTNGINFNNLSLRTSATSSPQVVNIIGNVCVVGNLTCFTIVTPPGAFNITGGTIYLHGNLNLTGSGMRNPSTTVLKMLGSNATITDTYVGGTPPLNLNVAVFGMSLQVEIASSGTVTLNSDIAFWYAGKLKHVSGSFISTGRTIVAGNNSTIEGFGTAGIKINALTHLTRGPSNNALSYLNFVDTTPISIGTLTFVGFNANNSHLHFGTIGWICDNFNYQPTPAATNFAFGLQAKTGIEYRITTSLIFRHYKIPSVVNPGAVTLNFRKNAGNTIPKVIFTLDPGATQDVYAVDALDIDSSLGQTIWNRKGVIPSTINWELWDYPKTTFATFTI